MILFAEVQAKTLAPAFISFKRLRLNGIYQYKNIVINSNDYLKFIFISVT